jgi:hypothetical protein
MGSALKTIAPVAALGTVGAAGAAGAPAVISSMGPGVIGTSTVAGMAPGIAAAGFTAPSAFGFSNMMDLGQAASGLFPQQQPPRVAGPPSAGRPGVQGRAMNVSRNAQPTFMVPAHKAVDSFRGSKVHSFYHGGRQ